MKKALVYDEEFGYANDLEAVLNPKGHKRTAPRYRAPIVKWKGVNTQFCIVCREGGEILCCEACPASFHLLCHTPPIQRDQIPSGKWFCHRCSTLPKDVQKTNILQNSEETETERNEMATNYVFDAASEEDREDPIKLITAASRVRNTQNFTLPDEIDPKIPLPHTSLPRPRVKVCNKNCTKCGRIVSDAPMIECDYCIAPYHLDCLDSPMTVPAKSRWMCPQHPENIIDKNLLKTNSLSKRLKLWDKHVETEVEPLESVLRFALKCKEEKEQQNDRVREKRVTIPPAIKRLYRERAEVDDPGVFPTTGARNEWVEDMVDMMASVASVHIPSMSGEEEIKEEEEEEEEKGSTLKRECIRRLKMCRSKKERALYSLALDRIQSIEIETAVVERRTVKAHIDHSRVQKNAFILGVIARESDPSAAIPIQKTVISVGTAKEADVYIRSVCRNIAPHHATIVFDKVAQRFELLPSSVEVVRVDGLDYGIDVAYSPPHERRGLIDGNTVIEDEDIKIEEDPEAIDDPTAPREELVCTCHLRKKEGRASQSAQLKHGSIIEFGCERFVFASFF